MQTTQQILMCTPIRLKDWEENKNTGKITIIKPKFEGHFSKKFLEPFFKSKNFRINLDELGTEVWINCDGKTTVEELGNILGKKFGSEIEPIYDLLIKFILELKRSKFIKLECPIGNK
jgi:hypothetical protein